eukprot:422431-Amphidinium_carterae.1
MSHVGEAFFRAVAFGVSLVGNQTLFGQKMVAIERENYFNYGASKIQYTGSSEEASLTDLRAIALHQSYHRIALQILMYACLLLHRPFVKTRFVWAKPDGTVVVCSIQDFQSLATKSHGKVERGTVLLSA